MLHQQSTLQETKEVEEIRDGQKCKVKYLVQHRLVPVRREAADLLKKLRNHSKTLPEVVSMNTNGQNLSKNIHGVHFNEGDREENVTNKLVKDKDKKLIDTLEKEKKGIPTDTKTAEELKKEGLLNKYGITDTQDTQHTFRITNLVMEGDPSDANDFEKGKAEFEKFIETVKENIFTTKKVRIRAHMNFRRQMTTNKFMGVSF